MKNMILILLLASIGLAAGSIDNTEGPLPSWQQSESLNIQLGVRDKNASLEIYEAVFIVHSVAGDNIFEAKIKVKSDDWGFVNFPEDFSVVVTAGDYHWKCMVGEKQVSSGRFTFGQDQRALTLPKK
jgi:hypothetical protein